MVVLDQQVILGRPTVLTKLLDLHWARNDGLLELILSLQISKGAITGVQWRPWSGIWFPGTQVGYPLGCKWFKMLLPIDHMLMKRCRHGRWLRYQLSGRPNLTNDSVLLLSMCYDGKCRYKLWSCLGVNWVAHRWTLIITSEYSGLRLLLPTDPPNQPSQKWDTTEIRSFCNWKIGKNCDSSVQLHYLAYSKHLSTEKFIKVYINVDSIMSTNIPGDASNVVTNLKYIMRGTRHWLLPTLAKCNQHRTGDANNTLLTKNRTQPNR